MLWRIGWALMGCIVLFPVEALPGATGSLGSHDEWDGFQRSVLARSEIFREDPGGSTSHTQPDPAAGLSRSEIPPAAVSTPTDSSAFHASPSTFAGMRRGARIRVEVKNDRVLEGPFLEARLEELAFEDAADTVVPYGDITSVWQWSSNRPKAMKQSAIFGSVVGGVALGLVAFAQRETGFCWGFGPCPKLEGSEQAAFVVTTTALGAALGAVAGTLFGAAVAWEHVWEPVALAPAPGKSETLSGPPRSDSLDD